MTHVACILRGGGTLMLVLVSASSFHGRQLRTRIPARSAKGSAIQAPAARAAYQKAFVIDDRLSVLRRQPGLQSEVIHRIRLGHAVYIVGATSGAGQPRFAEWP